MTKLTLLTKDGCSDTLTRFIVIPRDNSMNCTSKKVELRTRTR